MREDGEPFQVHETANPQTTYELVARKQKQHVSRDKRTGLAQRPQADVWWYHLVGDPDSVAISEGKTKAGERPTAFMLNFSDEKQRPPVAVTRVEDT